MIRWSSLVGVGILGVALLVGAGFSGESKKGEMRGMLPPGWKALSLSDAQKQQVYAVQSNYKAKVEDLKKQINELKAQERAEMARVLTPEQRALLIKLQVGEPPATTPTKTQEKKVVEKK